jgi:branched-chain amino acid transport system ATP-binding protein
VVERAMADDAAARMSAALRLTGGRVSYGALEALHGVDLVLPHGSVVALLGRNGAGKTSLLRALAGTVALTAGTLRVAEPESVPETVPAPERLPTPAPESAPAAGDEPERDWRRLPTALRARRGLMLLPEAGDGSVFGRLSVGENLRLFAGAGGDTRPAIEVFPVLGERLKQRADTLSGGQRQMLAASRALLAPWRVLLVDELSRGLAPAVAARLYGLLAGLAHQRDGASAPRTVVFAEPYARHVLELADLVYVLRRGEVVFVGERAEATPERLRDLLG